MNDSGHSLTYVGAGGNIGSHAVVAMARTGLFSLMRLVDPDVYEPRNLISQDISRRALGCRKVDVLAARLRRIDPGLRVEVIAERVERVPLGRLRGDVIATGLDGLASRRWVNRAARRLGVRWVDAGVRGEGLLARVDVFEPVEGAACLECGWSAAEHAALDNRYPCDPPAASAPTGAPAWLGAIAAGVQSAECAKLVTGGDGLLGRQILLEASSYRAYVSAHRRSPDCPFDHDPWWVRALPQTPGAITLDRALGLLPSPGGAPARMRVHGDSFVRRLVCRECDGSRETMVLGGRIDGGARICPGCGAAMVASGLDTTDSLADDRLTSADRRVSLYALGLREGDVFSIENASGEAHFAIGAW